MWRTSMDKDSYRAEIKLCLRSYFSASWDGYMASAENRHRLDAFMLAAVFMRLATSAELDRVMERIHFDVFGKSIEERRQEGEARWQESVINYDRYDQPAYERAGRSLSDM